MYKIKLFSFHQNLFIPQKMSTISLVAKKIYEVFLISLSLASHIWLDQ